MIYLGSKLHIGQRKIVNAIINTDKRYYVIVTPRQFGKSYLAIQLLLYFSINNPNSITMFASPTYQQCNKVLRELLSGVKNSDIITKRSGQDVFLKNGSIIYFRSIHNAENLRGYTLDFLLCDEAALYKSSVFEEVLKPMLSTKRKAKKKCVFFSTPKGKNWFYDKFKIGERDDSDNLWMSLRGSSIDNPFRDDDEINDAKKTLPQKIFDQEYLGIFIEDQGEVFTNISSVCSMESWPAYNQNIKYYAAVDVGKQVDFTVVTVIGSDNVIYEIYRVNGTSYREIALNVSEILKKWKPVSTFVERNGVGDPFFEMLKEECGSIKIEPFWTGNNKNDIIEDLIIAFNELKIVCPSRNLFKHLDDELFDFSFTYNKNSRRISYAARSGHDDCVMSLAIAYNCKKQKERTGRYIMI